MMLILSGCHKQEASLIVNTTEDNLKPVTFEYVDTFQLLEGEDLGDIERLNEENIIGAVDDIVPEIMGNEGIVRKNSRVEATVYSKPDNTGGNLGKLENGENVSVIATYENDGWEQIIYNGRIAYVYKEALGDDRPIRPAQANNHEEEPAEEPEVIITQADIDALPEAEKLKLYNALKEAEAEKKRQQEAKKQAQVEQSAQAPAPEVEQAPETDAQPASVEPQAEAQPAQAQEPAPEELPQ